VPQRDRPGGRHRVVELCGGAGEDAAVGQLRQPPLEALVELQQTGLDETERGDGHDDLVIDWMRMMASSRSGDPPTEATPAHTTCTSAEASRATAPGIVPAST
jgi:hypothetical protein